jgi:hypothetical protein
MTTQDNVDRSELQRFGALAPRWWSSAARWRDALKRIARAARGSGRDAGRGALQGWTAAPEAR